MLKQNIVFVENKKGSLKRVTEILKENGVYVYGFACFDAPEYALFRMIADDAEKAEAILNEKGYMNRISRVTAVNLGEVVDGLDSILGVFDESNINLDYVYIAYHKTSQIPAVIIHSEEMTTAECILEHKGYHVLNDVKELMK